MCLQPWRLVTYQFLHDASGFGHIFGNMLGLFFFGRMLERLWGSRKFLIFYLVCGAIGGAIYPLLVWAGFLTEGFLIGASGAVFGVIAAVAILFPRVLVYIWGVFPIPMMALAAMYLLISIILLLRGDNTGGQMAHLAGMATGALYVLYQPWRQRLKQKMQDGAWERKRSEQRYTQAEIDRILQKVHDRGIHSLTSKERKVLRQATREQQLRDKF
jgi:membrane associated rhomboid family serine protease